MRLLKLHPAETRGELDPLPFPVNAVRQLRASRAARANGADAHDCMDSIEYAETAMRNTDRLMGRLSRETEDLFRPFHTRDQNDGPRAA